MKCLCAVPRLTRCHGPGGVAQSCKGVLEGCKLIRNPADISPADVTGLIEGSTVLDAA